MKATICIGVSASGKSTWTEQQDAYEINRDKLRNRGLTHQEIADIMGASKAWVSKELAGVSRGVERVAVDETRIKAIAMVKELLLKLEAL